MKIFITGGSGCLGANLVEHWLPKGHQILVVDNFATSKKESLPDNISGLEVIEGSIYDKDFLDKCFVGFKPTHVIHSAASYKDPDNWEEDSKTNVLGTINVVKCSEKYQVKRLVNFQTALCYGRPKSVPVSIEHGTNPFTSYGISKTAGEAYVLNSSISSVSLRLANICGPRLSIGPIPTFYKRLQEGKECFCSDTIRDFLDMSDFLSLMDIVIDENAPQGVYNVSTGEGHSIKDIFDVVANYLGLKNLNVPIVPVGDDDVQAVVLEPQKTKNVFKWEAKVSFEDTILNQLNWYRKYGITDIYSHLAEPKK